MYPGMMHWWKRAHRHTGKDSYAQCGGGWAEASAMSAAAEGWGGHGHFGVRRPLRFLAYKLELNETQVTELAKILDELKTERAQAEVDERRSLSTFADAFAGERFDAQLAENAGAQRVKTAEALRAAVLKALSRIHQILEPGQRDKFAHLVRTGVLSL